MKEVTAFYKVHGASLRVEAENRQLADLAQAVLKPYRTTCRVASPHVLHLRCGDPRPTAASVLLPQFWQGVLPEGQPIICRAGPAGRSIELPGLAFAYMGAHERHALIIIQSGASGPVVDGCIMPVLCEFLGRQGRHVIHAGSLVLKRGRRRRAVLLSGVSGAGKTTASLALTGAGMELMTDDSTFVGPGRNRSDLRVWGMPTRLKVLTRTLDLLPWLQELPRQPGRVRTEFSIDAALLAPPGPRRTAEPGAIVFLDARNDHAHRVEAIDKTTTLTRLVRENVRAYDRTAEGPAGRAFVALANLVRVSRTWRVSLCPDLESLYDVIAPLVER